MSLTAPLMSPLSFLDDLSSDLEFLRVLFFVWRMRFRGEGLPSEKFR